MSKQTPPRTPKAAKEAVARLSPGVLRHPVAVANIATCLIIALTNLRNAIAGLINLPQQGPLVGILGGLLAATFLWVFYVGPVIRRVKHPPSAKPGVFRLRPYGEADRGQFRRDDNEHQRILTWLNAAEEPILFLVGPSGSGKTSLLHAFVLPELRAAGRVAVAVRGVRDPLGQLRAALLEAGLVWKQPDEKANLTPAELAEQAAARLARNERRLFIVFDQFEELLILHERNSPDVVGVVDFVKRFGAVAREHRATVLLVMRTDYEGRLRDLGFAAARLGDNYEVVRLVNEDFALAFLKRGLANDELCGRLVREASDLEENPGRLRLITLNLLGLAAAELAGKGRGRRGGRGRLRGAVRQWVTVPEVADVAACVLRPLISEQETKQPRSLKELAEESGLPQREVERALRCFERDGLVRRYENEADVWEISHDFVARLLQRVLDELDANITRHLRRWAAPALGMVALLALAAFGSALYTRYCYLRQHWDNAKGEVVRLNADGEPDPRGELRVRFGHPGVVVNDTLRYLCLLPGQSEVRKLDLSNTPLENLTGMPTLPQLASLDLEGSQLTTVVGMPTLPQLTSLHLSSTKSLTTLVGMPMLPQLRSLFLRNSHLTSLAGMPALPQLRSLFLRDTHLTSLAGMPTLPQLAWLELFGNRRTILREMPALPSLCTLVIDEDETPPTVPLSARQVVVLHYSNSADHTVAPAIVTWLLDESRLPALRCVVFDGDPAELTQRRDVLHLTLQEWDREGDEFTFCSPGGAPSTSAPATSRP